MRVKAKVARLIPRFLPFKVLPTRIGLDTTTYCTISLSYDWIVNILDLLLDFNSLVTDLFGGLFRSIKKRWRK